GRLIHTQSAFRGTAGQVRRASAVENSRGSRYATHRHGYQIHLATAKLLPTTSLLPAIFTAGTSRGPIAAASKQSARRSARKLRKCGEWKLTVIRRTPVSQARR